MTNAITIFLVDDEEAIRHSASFMLRHAGYRVKTFADGPSFLSFLKGDTAGCVLLDVRMPEMDGLTVLNKARELGATLPIIILTGHGDVSTAVTAMKSGATDFLEKPYEKNALVHAITNAMNKVDEGEALAQQKSRAQAKLNALTARETDVLRLLVDGLTNKGIAGELGISARTVEIHRANLMAKLDAESLSSALKIAFTAGLNDGGTD